MFRRHAWYQWLRAAGQGQTALLADASANSCARRDRRSVSARDRDTGVIDRLPAELRRDIVCGRAALAESAGHSHPGDLLRENEPIARLLALLWHEDAEVRRAAAHALPGGDYHRAHSAPYGHFAGAFLRELSATMKPDAAEALPPTAADRYAHVVTALRALLDQNSSEIRGMSNMNYSFLSSALYLAVLATCRDVLFALRRLRAADAQTELCRLLWNLSQLSVLRCLNGQDLDVLARATGQALASLPPDQMPDFWHSLTHPSEPRRLAVAPALRYFRDRRATPYLLDALEERHAQPAEVTVCLLACLGRLEDARALPALQPLTASRDRQLRAGAIAAIAAIQRAGHKQPSRTLLRATPTPETQDSETLLRSAPVNHHEAEPPFELLRTASPLPEKKAVPDG